MKFEPRLGGYTARVGPLNAVFVDEHSDWYAVHWTSRLEPESFLDFVSKVMDIPGDTPTLVQFASSERELALEELHYGTSDLRENLSFLRLDLADYVLVWEPSTEYRQALQQDPAVPYTAVVGFGSHLFDENFTRWLIGETASSSLMELVPEMISDPILQERLAGRYKTEPIRMNERADND